MTPENRLAPTTAGWERRLARIEDLTAIRDLSARYALAIDGRDYEGLRALLTADASFGGTSDGAAGVVGADDVVGFIRRRLENGGPTCHMVYDVVVDFDADDRDIASGTATSRAEALVGAEVVVNTVRYIDEYRRGASGWRFRRRLLSFPMK